MEKVRPRAIAGDASSDRSPQIPGDGPRRGPSLRMASSPWRVMPSYGLAAVDHPLQQAPRADERLLKDVKQETDDAIRAGRRMSGKPCSGERMPLKRRRLFLTKPLKLRLSIFECKRTVIRI
jgi:hypothetical protein